MNTGLSSFLVFSRHARYLGTILGNKVEEFGGLVAATRVTVFNNGSLRLEGDFEIVDQEGRPFGLGGRTAVTLCRCGRSGNQPFCDGTHKRENFSSTVTARDLPPVIRI